LVSQPQPLAVKTRNRHLGYIRNTFGLAREWNLIEADPFEHVNGFNDPHAKTRKVEILTPEQLQAFLNVVDRDFLSFFALSAFSGLRREEIIRLDWSEAKLERNLIDLPFTKSKNRCRKLIEVPENLEAWLSPFVRKSGSVMPRKKATARFRKCCQSRRDRPVATERIATLLLFLCSRPKGVRVDLHASRPLRTDVAEALLGGGGSGDGGEVLGHSALKSTPRALGLAARVRESG
jgi:integrase